MQRFMMILCVALFASGAQAKDKIVDMADMDAGHNIEITQITDPSATAATGMFRFDPAIVYLDPGDAVVFLNSRGEHTVHSAVPLWPEGKELVAISNQKRAEVRFDQAGVFGFRCKRHGQYGMAMLVIVGDVSEVASIEEPVSTMKARPREKAAFLAIWQEHLDRR
ncbi:MAG: plastocyanin/azurin family copper-binding protein [Pelagimonas sp.]|uniref:plastocyanin/azurin family copper-binding protein n=1 Tax=Pelagimonas sp. TaxID=2073170 RepID=UPI003D6B2113